MLPKQDGGVTHECVRPTWGPAVQQAGCGVRGRPAAQRWGSRAPCIEFVKMCCQNLWGGESFVT